MEESAVPLLAFNAMPTWPFKSTDTIIFILTALLICRYLKTVGSTLSDEEVPHAATSSNDQINTQDEDDENDDNDRSICQVLKKHNHKCAVVFGSQTGTAEGYASRVAQEGRSTFSLPALLADAEEYSWTDLHKVGDDEIIIFVLATYGEGEPTDNALGLYEKLSSLAEEATGNTLSNLNYAAFGLGNKTYEHYNNVVHNVDKALQRLGAHRLGPVGEGDDAEGTMEEDFLSWKAIMWQSVSKHLGLEEHRAKYEPMLKISPREDLSLQSPDVYLGESTSQQLNGLVAPAGPHQPFVAQVTESRELFRMPDRNCIHLEVDLSGSGLRYQAGDHIAVWPMNSNVEVDRFLHVNGLLENRDNIIDIDSLDPTTKVPCPKPTTYDSIARYYLEITAAVSRELLARFAPFAPNEEAEDKLNRLSDDAEYFAKTVTAKYLSLSQVLELAGGKHHWDRVPFSLYLESLNRLRPRYYSISSSPLLHPNHVSITVVVDTAKLPNRTDSWKGVASNYLLAIKQDRDSRRIEGAVSAYTINGPRGMYSGSRIPVHIRASKFRLPEDTSASIIMVGPGTGVAPFRGFLQERIAQLEAGLPVGKSILFYGCRNSSQDFLYKEEFEVSDCFQVNCSIE